LGGSAGDDVTTGSAGRMRGSAVGTASDVLETTPSFSKIALSIPVSPGRYGRSTLSRLMDLILGRWDG
jgi:hypothetical protein